MAITTRKALESGLIKKFTYLSLVIGINSERYWVCYQQVRSIQIKPSSFFGEETKIRYTYRKK